MASTNTTSYPPGYLEENKGPQSIAIMIPFAVVATLAVAGRLASRRIKNLSLELDDLTAVVALVRRPSPPKKGTVPWLTDFITVTHLGLLFIRCCL